jgi:hypothetical protein
LRRLHHSRACITTQVDFTSFKAGPIQDGVFEAPALCADSKRAAATRQPDAATRHAAQALSASAALMPWGRVNALSSSSGASSGAAGAAAELQQLQRLAVRADNARFVSDWNAAAAASSGNSGSSGGFKLALNRFADTLPEEFALLAAAKRSSPASELVKQVRRRGGGLTAGHSTDIVVGAAMQPSPEA